MPRQPQPSHNPRQTGMARMPGWAWAVIAVLACIDPLTHVWIAIFPPPGCVPTGMHTGDSGHHLICMRMFESGFFSPYAVCGDPPGASSFRYFAPPLFLLYGVAGAVAHLLRIAPFIALGVANGLGLALYLRASYAFLSAAAPRLANRAFVLFALGGGLGGVLYLITGVLGLHDAPAFEEYFRRYAHYELIEGPHLAPWLLTNRLYYTAPLALAFAGLAGFIRHGDLSRKGPLALSLAALGLASFLNLRIGPAMWTIGMIYLFAGNAQHPLKRALLLALPVAVGGAAGWGMISLSPAYADNLRETVRMSMWWSPFLSAALFLLAAAALAMPLTLRGMKWPARVMAGAALGYLAMFTALYALYQAYYGHPGRCLDVTAAIRLSDWAMLGIPVGVAALEWRRKRAGGDVQGVDNETAWMALWFLLFVSVAVSAFGQGWFLKFQPQRLMVFLGLPLAVLAAAGLDRLGRCAQRACMGFILTCGVCSLAVASTCFQGPLGLVPGRGAFAYLHYECMTPADGALLERLQPGVVLTPPWSPISFGEIVALRPSLPVVGGPGAMNLSAERFCTLQAEVNAFFNLAATEQDRRSLVRRYCVETIYLPDTCVLPPELEAQLAGYGWLRETDRAGRGVVFTVMEEGVSDAR